MGLFLSVSYYRSGKLIFRLVGADGQLQNMCRLLFLFFDLLKFDLQLSVSQPLGGGDGGGTDEVVELIFLLI